MLKRAWLPSTGRYNAAELIALLPFAGWGCAMSGKKVQLVLQRGRVGVDAGLMIDWDDEKRAGIK